MKRSFLYAIAFLFTLAFPSLGALPSLDGSWISNCYTQQNESTFAKDTMTFKDHDVDALVAGYSDDKCATQSFAVEVKGTFQQGKQSEFVKTATEVDSTISSISLTFFAADVCTELSQMQFCGISEWKAGVAVDVTGRKCSDQEMPKAGDRAYDIYSLLSEKTLVSGKMTKEFDGTSPEKRPHELDMDKQYQKQ